MSPDKLVIMANQIAKFFVSQGKDKASAGIADHLKNFWGPGMRAGLIAYWRTGGEGLELEVRSAVAQLAREEDGPEKAAAKEALTKPNSRFWMGLRPRVSRFRRAK